MNNTYIARIPRNSSIARGYFDRIEIVWMGGKHVVEYREPVQMNQGRACMIEEFVKFMRDSFVVVDSVNVDFNADKPEITFDIELISTHLDN